MLGAKWIARLGIGLLLMVPVGCSNPESEEAGQAIQEAAEQTGEAIEASAQEAVEQTGAALEEAGEQLQSSVEATPDPAAAPDAEAEAPGEPVKQP